MSVPVGSAFLIEPVPEEIFTPEDFTEEQRAMARTAEEFVDREVIPRIAELEENKPGVVSTLLKRAGEIGLLAIEVPEEYGGLGLDKATAMLVSERAAKVASFSVLAVEDLTVVADRGYFKGEEILACEESGIKTYVPKPQTSGNQAKGLFGKRDFHYVPEENEYRCPAGECLPWRMTTEEKGQTLHRYWSAACQGCSIKSQCTTGKERRVTRWEHEAVLEAMQTRLEHEPDKMRIRQETAEHPYGTIKMWMGATHFQTKTLARVSTEMSLHVLAYNMKRVINILGIGALMEAIRAFNPVYA